MNTKKNLQGFNSIFLLDDSSISRIFSENRKIPSYTTMLVFSSRCYSSHHNICTSALAGRGRHATHLYVHGLLSVRPATIRYKCYNIKSSNRAYSILYLHIFIIHECAIHIHKYDGEKNTSCNNNKKTARVVGRRSSR